MLSLPKHPAVRRILFFLFVTLDSSTTLPVLPFSKALLREYMRYATLASKLLALH